MHPVPRFFSVLPTFTPVHIAIDEAQDVIADVPEAVPLIESLARRGRKLGMYLTLGVQDKQVKTLGLDGKGDLRRNFQVAEVLKRPDGQRVAIIHGADDKTTIPIPDLPDPESCIQRRSQPASPDDLLPRLLTNDLPGSAAHDHPGTSSGSAHDHETRSAAAARPGTSAGSGSVDDQRTGTGTGSAGGSHAAESLETHIAQDGRTVRIDVHASAAVTKPPSTGRRRRRGLATTRHQTASDYCRVKALVAQGTSANAIQKDLGVNRSKVLELVRRAKAELGT